MAKRKRDVPAIACYPGESSPSAALKKTSRWEKHPWKTGEIPNRPLITVIAPNDAKRPAYGEYFGVEPPTNSGNKLPGGKL